MLPWRPSRKGHAIVLLYLHTAKYITSTVSAATDKLCRHNHDNVGNTNKETKSESVSCFQLFSCTSVTQ